jgi:hypothetical protein
MLVILVEVGRREGKALGSEEVNTLRCRVIGRGKELSRSTDGILILTLGKLH